MQNCQRILVPLDGTEVAEAALNPAISLAAETDAELLLLRVIISNKAALAAADRRVLYGDVEARERDVAESYLQNVQTALTGRHDSIKTAVVAGPVAKTIVDYADKRQINLIVMSSHCRSGLSRWLKGSIAQEVRRRASCTTLIIPKNRVHHRV